MKRLLALVALAVAELCSAQTAVTPIIQPHITLFTTNGVACSLCSLYTYSAGTTTPLATYTDSTGTVQNTNPVVLDVSGSANVWVGTTSTYKFVLKNALGATVWTVDNVKSTSGGLPCSTPYTIQFANAAGTALACDSLITINTTNHSINVGGAITGQSFTLGNLGTITSSWTLDITSPSTALASLGAIPVANLAAIGSDAVIMNATGSSAVPTAVTVPNCASGLYFASHAFGCLSSSVPLSNLAAQAADTVVMNATAGSASPTAVAVPSCPNGLQYSSHAFGCLGTSSTVCSGTSIPWGCYRIGPDGTIDEWGVSIAASTGGNSSTIGINFPHAFTTTDNLLVTVSPDACPNGTCGGSYVLSANLVAGTLSTLSVDAYLGSGTPVGGGGGNITGTVHVNWRATGK